MSGICPVATWMPTPVRKPISTDAERKSPRNPSRSTRASTSSTAHSSAASPQSATHFAEPGCSPPIPAASSPADRIAAVAESPPTTSSFEEPSSANAASGNRIVYRPVTMGVCEIDV